MKFLEEYTKLIDKEIAFLIEDKDNYANEISEIATYLDLNEYDSDLTKLDIEAINEKRRTIYAMYKLIEDLETLKSRVKTVGFKERW